VGEGEEESAMKPRVYCRGHGFRRFFVNGLRYPPILFFSVALAVIFTIASAVVRWFAG